MSEERQLTALQQGVLEQIRRGIPSPKGYPRTYELGTPELMAAKELAEMGLVFYDSSDHPAGWYLTAKGRKAKQTAPDAATPRAGLGTEVSND